MIGTEVAVQVNTTRAVPHKALYRRFQLFHTQNQRIYIRYSLTTARKQGSFGHLIIIFFCRCSVSCSDVSVVSVVQLKLFWFTLLGQSGLQVSKHVLQKSSVPQSCKILLVHVCQSLSDGCSIKVFFSEHILVRTSLPRCLCEIDASPPPLCLLLSSYQTYL